MNRQQRFASIGLALVHAVAGKLTSVHKVVQAVQHASTQKPEQSKTKGSGGKTNGFVSVAFGFGSRLRDRYL